MVSTSSRLQMLAATLLLSLAASTIECDWDGAKYFTSPKNSGEHPVVWYCHKDTLAIIYEEDWLSSSGGSAVRAAKAHEERLQRVENLTTIDYQTACEWDGLLLFRGTGNCDDFAFACHDGHMTSFMFVGNTQATTLKCDSYYDCPAQVERPYMSCNFGQPMSITGKEGVELVFRCVGGIMSGVYANYGVGVAQQQQQQQQQQGLLSPPEPEVAPPNRNFLKTTSTSQCLSWATAVGSWQLVQSSNQPFTLTVEYGTETSDTQGLSEEWSLSLNASMTAGIDFLSESVDLNISESISTSMESTLTQSFGQSFEFTCPKGQMWQWVVENGRPWESRSSWGTKVTSQIMWCTLDAYEAPKCPPGACDCGDDCSTSDCQTCQPFEGSHADKTVFVPPSCDWTGKRRMRGSKPNEDYYFDCEDNVMLGVTTSSGLLQGSSSCSGCDWVGVRHMTGSGDDEDLYLECCGSTQSIVGIYAIDGEEADQPGDSGAGMPCSWEGQRRASGTNSDDDFYLYCEDGLLTEIRAIPDFSIAIV